MTFSAVNDQVEHALGPVRATRQGAITPARTDKTGKAEDSRLFLWCVLFVCGLLVDLYMSLSRCSFFLYT